MGIINKYVMVIESDEPPQVFLNDTIPKVGKSLNLKQSNYPTV
jgi:hypothetical protein